MMKIALASLAALVAAGAVPAAADQASAVTRITDVAGDANYVNDGGEFTFGDTPTPGSDPSLDILDVTLAPTHSRTGARNGFTVVVNTLAPLRDRAQVKVKMRTPNCADIVIAYVNTTEPRAVVSGDCWAGLSSVSAVKDGPRLTVTVPFAAMPVPKKDKVLQTVNVFSQIYLLNEPLRNRPSGLLGADTTIGQTTYRLR